jgi:hypothetical protein
MSAHGQKWWENYDYYWSQIRRRYALTKEQYDAMFAAQGFKCAACRTDKPGNMKRWHIHHTGSLDKGTLVVQGILCHHCNIAARSGSGEVVQQLERLVAWLKGKLK